MIKQLLATTILATAAFGAFADDYDTMYLIKGDHVVGKYKVDDVDYATFTLPEGVSDANLSVSVDNVGKNEVSYTVSTVNPSVAYAHNALSFYEVEYMAMDLMGNFFDSLEEEEKTQVLKYALSYNAYTGADTKTYTMRDFESDGTGTRFSVMPGTRHFLCAWEIDPKDYSPLETFVVTEFTTVAPEKGSATLNCNFVEVNEYGALINFTGSNVKYVRTCWGPRSTMDAYVSYYGLDYLLGLFGQNWTLDFLQDTGDVGEGVPNSIWPTDGSGEYVLFSRAYDADGNITDVRTDVSVSEGSEDNGPKINIFSKDKKEGYVKVNFEITPSNVEEAYVRLCGENFVDDRLNMGYELHEIAMGGDAEDITSTINSEGEYTYTNSEVSEEWKALLIYAKDKDGNRSTLRINFFPDPSTEWSIYDPVAAKAPAMKIPAVKRIVSKRNPTLRRCER